LEGDLIGPYVSQFLLLGNDDPSFNRSYLDGYITYGSLSIDQRQGTVQSRKPPKPPNVPNDYLTSYHITTNS
jgi:hypothetical protein